MLASTSGATTATSSTTNNNGVAAASWGKLSFRRSHQNATTTNNNKNKNVKVRGQQTLKQPRRRSNLTIVNVATPSKKSSAEPPKEPKRSAVEIIKENSDFLRHPLIEQLATPETFISEDAAQLYKFHGGYQQDDREKRSFGEGKFYQFMMRTKQPAGLVSNKLYLTMDDLANTHGNGTLRLTTRQTYQLHGILKQDLKQTFRTVIQNMGSTLGACGDINRNVTAAPCPDKKNPSYEIAQTLALDIAELLAPQSGAYYDVWVDGEQAMTVEKPEITKARMDNSNGTNFEGSQEPIYGSLFLPRKFKIGVTVPGDNHIDFLSNDIGICVVNDAGGKHVGYNVYAGGGMGRSHRNNETFPRIASPIGYVDKDDIFYAVKAIVCTQRDYGRRDDRKQSRLKYLVHSWGVEKFTSVTEQYFGKKFQPIAPLPEFEFKSYLGWNDQGDGKLWYGVHVQNGRLRGELKKALRLVIERYELPVRLTAQQDLLLCDVDPKWKDDIHQTLKNAGLKDLDDIEPNDQLSMACPALPLCGLAITEAERGLPDINKRLREVMETVGLTKADDIMIRMTGCPNGCARPYMAELSFVGDGPNSYQIWLGGTRNLTGIARAYEDKVKVDDLETFFEPIFAYWKQNRNSGEEFGQFVNRVSFEEMKAFSGSYVPGQLVSAERLPRVMVERAALDKLIKYAEENNTTLTAAATKAIMDL